MQRKVLFFMVFICVLHKSFGYDCKIPEGEKEVKFMTGCTSFSMNPKGNYTALNTLWIWGSQVTTMAMYDLLNKLTAAPALSSMYIGDNFSLKTFDIAEFNQLKKLSNLYVWVCPDIKFVYTAKVDNQNLKYLDFQNDDIEFIDIPFFKRFAALESINLGKNRLPSILDIGILSELKTLRRFDVNNNEIAEVVNTKISLKILNIVMIGINFNNIKSLNFDIFDSFPNLEELNLSSNLFSGPFDLNKLSKLEKLTVLYLYGSHNITRIMNSGTAIRPKMWRIGLSYSGLTFLDLEDFKVFTNLQYMDLEGNQLVTIFGYRDAKKILPKMMKIPIENNEFDCFQLKKMTEPYIGTAFWYWNKQTSCPSDKVLFENTQCCYPVN